MEHNVKLTIAYDGTDFHGFQIQKNPELPSIQGTLQEALKVITLKDITITGSGRTDAGVHAWGQVVNFKSDLNVPMTKWPHALRPYLPPTICVRDSLYVPEDFDARFSAKRKTYRYLIYNDSIMGPMFLRYAYHVPYELDFEAMIRATKYIVGEKDFKSFCKSEAPIDNYVREVISCDIVPIAGPLIAIDVCGTGFLWNMVRIICGTLLDVGTGRFQPEDVKDIIEARDRTKAGMTVPPQGLCLLNVEY